MKTVFKYDYNNKIFIITLIVSLIFLFFTTILIRHLIPFVIFLVLTSISFFNSFFVIKKQGITIDKKNNKIIIVDQMFYRKLNIDEIKFVTIEEIKKEKKGNLYGFFCEFFYPSTYISHCNFVYNQGKVFYICFHMSNGHIEKSYFGWLYKEKGSLVKKIETNLIKFVKEINLTCKLP